MRYENEKMQDRLAAEFVLGNLRGAARSRVITLMRRHPRLRDKVALWEERLFPLIVRAPKVQPPAHVWRAIRARVAGRSVGRWGWFTGWAAGGLATVALAAVAYLAVAPPREPLYTMVAVLNDARAMPSIMVSWTPRQAADRQIAVRILAHPSMPPDTSWQAWLVSGRGDPPIPLGLVSTEETQVIEIPPTAANTLRGATAIGVSVEPKGGSITGRPAGPFMFEGPLLRVGS